MMEWRQQTSVSCADAFIEAQRWIEEVTGKEFGCKDFRASLENGVLLCDLINQLKPGIIKRVNRLSTPIAGLDNVNVFLKGCGKLGLNVSQLFHPGDLQDLSTRATLRRDESNRRLKNVLITIYWLGRKAHLDALYNGPQLNFKAFEGLLGLALSKALDEGSNVFVKDSWYPEREECLQMRRSYKVEKSVDSQALRPNSEGCGSDPEAEQVFKMETIQPSVKQVKGYLPPPLQQRNQGVEENGKDSASPLARAYQIQVRPENVQVNPGWIWSKSLGDIPMAYPVRKSPDAKFRYSVGQDRHIAQEWNQENKHKCSIAAKNGEAQWQDDLTKWKNRRRSTKSEFYQKSQDREHVINKMIDGAFSAFEKNEPGRLLKSIHRDQQSPHKHNPATHSPPISPSKSSGSDLQPKTRALLVRCFATETPFSPAAPTSCNNVAQTQGATAAAMPASDGKVLAEGTHVASLASDKGGVTTPSLDYPFSSQTQVKVQGSPAPLLPKSELAQPENVYARQISTLITTIQPNKTTKSTTTRDPTPSMSSHKEHQCCTNPKVPTSFSADTVNMAAVDALEDRQYRKSLEENRRTSSEPAVDVGRGQQVSTVYKPLSGAGSWSCSASLPRGYRRSEGSVRLSSAITPKPFWTKQSRMSSLPRLCYVDDNQGFLLKSEKAESFSPPIKSLLKRQTASVHLTGQPQPSIRQKAKQNGTEEAEEVKDVPLVSQATFQTNGHHHLQAQHNKTSPLPSNATTDHRKVDHSDMRVSFTLKPNSRPDFGFQTHWDYTGVRVKFIKPGSPAELCQLCVDDEIVAVNGVEVAHMSYTQWKDKMTSSLQTGSLTMDIRRYGNKDWSTSDGVHPSQPGQSKMTLNLTTAAPVLIGYPDHRANSGISAETTGRRMSEFNGQTDNVLQGKVMHGELAENHRTARSKGGSASAISDLQVPCLSPSSSSWSWNHEEDRRRQEKWQEEQERLLQEQYQRDQERLEAEWQRAQQDATGELYMESGSTVQMTNGGERPAGAQPQVYGSTNKVRGEEPSPDGDEPKDGSKPLSDGQGVQKDEMTEKARVDNSCGFVQLSPAHRAKSLSTPALAGPHKQTRGDERKDRSSLSKVEQERQQILEEMKKRTQLLTDNSWIRQRRSCSYKEPVYIGAPLKRFESLDNLESLRQSPLWSTTFSYPRPHSAAAGYCAPSRTSRHSTGGILSHRNGTVDPSHHSRVSPANAWSPSLNLKQEAIL